MLAEYLTANTKIFTALSPVLIVVYNSAKNPLFMVGEKDRNQGLADLAQKGDASVLEKALMKQPWSEICVCDERLHKQRYCCPG